MCTVDDELLVGATKFIDKSANDKKPFKLSAAAG